MSVACEHIPCDMTATVDVGMTLGALQFELAKGGQWLPLDPPFPGRLTVAEMIAQNLSGPRRFGYGTIRDYVIGLKVRLPDGRVIKSGGKVVKNVAGYDLQKLFIGAKDALGGIVEATFKLRPKPVAEIILRKPCATIAEAGKLIDAILGSPLTPVILDLYRVKTNSFVVVAGFDGAREEVDWQRAKAREFGILETTNLEYDERFQETQDAIHKISVLPSKLIETINAHSRGDFVARAGNGILFYHGVPPALESSLPTQLWRRAEMAFNPKGISP